jgi:catalase (peroxidase I)
MLTSDVALKEDPSYWALVQQFATDQSSFDNAFKHAWYKLVSRDMGPVARCLGDEVPVAQAWQYPLPAAPANLADFSAVETEIRSSLLSGEQAATNAPLLVRLSWQVGGEGWRREWGGRGEVAGTASMSRKF